MSVAQQLDQDIHQDPYLGFLLDHLPKAVLLDHLPPKG
jgi:hypothetical protein